MHKMVWKEDEATGDLVLQVDEYVRARIPSPRAAPANDCTQEGLRRELEDLKRRLEMLLHGTAPPPRPEDQDDGPDSGPLEKPGEKPRPGPERPVGG